MGEMAIADFVLVETVASKRQGRTLWFKQMTGIGPMTTSDPAEREVFGSREAAGLCPALWHPLSFFEVRQVCPVCGDEGNIGPCGDGLAACPLGDERGHALPAGGVAA